MRKLFADHSTFQITQECQSQIEDACQYFRSGLEALEKFEGVCRENLENYSGLRDEVRNLMLGVRDVSGFYSEKYGGTQVDAPEREKTRNPYEELLNWTRKDILDLRGIIEAIQKRQELVRVKEKIEEKLEEERAKLARVQSGKKSIGQMLSKRTKEEQILGAEADVRHLEEEIESLGIILNISSARMIYEVITEFKESKTNTFEFIMKGFAEASIKEFSMFINEARHLELKLT